MNTPSPSPIRIVSITESDALLKLLVASFYDYPVMRYVLQNSLQYSEDIQSLIRFFIKARTLKKEVLLGAFEHDQLMGGALVSFPGRSLTPPELILEREACWSILGREAQRRYDAFGTACEAFELPEAHVHLNMIGVAPEAQGRGISRKILEEVHRISDQDPESTGVSLTTETTKNLSYYEHFGYQLQDKVKVDEELFSYGFFRPKASV